MSMYMYLMAGSDNRDISDQELISCLHDQFTIRHVHGGDS